MGEDVLNDPIDKWLERQVDEYNDTEDDDSDEDIWRG